MDDYEPSEEPPNELMSFKCDERLMRSRQPNIRIDWDAVDHERMIAEESEQLSRQQKWNTVDTQEQSSPSIHKISTSQWQIPRETSKARPLFSNQITTRNYYGVLEDCGTVTRDLEM